MVGADIHLQPSRGRRAPLKCQPWKGVSYTEVDAPEYFLLYFIISLITSVLSNVICQC